MAGININFTAFLYITATLLPSLCQDVPDTCYKKVGCFSNKPPWISETRRLPAPEAPKHVCRQVILYTRTTPNLTLAIYPDIAKAFDRVFNPARETFILCHGYNQNRSSVWLTNLTYAILNRTDANVIIVDWGIGAKPPRCQASSNTRVVAAVVELLVKHLKRHGAQTEKFHLVGFSLGAVALSYLANRLMTVGSLTGLDPANMYFTGQPKEVRFDPEDANITIAVRTNIGGLGVGGPGPAARIEFILNGGSLQPLCLTSKGPKQDVQRYIRQGPELCSHQLSHVFYTYSIRYPYCFVGKPIENQYQNTSATLSPTPYSVQYSDKECPSVPAGVPLGLETMNYHVTGSFAISTTLEPPYCHCHGQSH